MEPRFAHPDIYTIAFYNTENFFHFKPSHLASKEKSLPFSRRNWTKDRYKTKIQNIGLAISKIGRDTSQNLPAIIGLAEIENNTVLSDLIQSRALKPHPYDFVYFESPDPRGISVALLYNRHYFILNHAQAIALNLENGCETNTPTRDILKVSGYLGQEPIYILVNHWPSRHKHSDASGQKRLDAAKQTVDLIHSICRKDSSAKIIVMGDFNDTPKNDSIELLKTNGSLFNPMEQLLSFKRGSVKHHSKWLLFDQILLTTNLLNPQQNELKLIKTDIFDAPFLKHLYGKHKGKPFRTYTKQRYHGGFSDHFPVYIQLKTFFG